MRFKFLVILLICASMYGSEAQTIGKQPFFTKTITKTKEGLIKSSLKLPGGQVFDSYGSREMGKCLFFLNGKSYDEEEVQQLDPAPFKKQQFYPVTAYEYEIEGRDLNLYYGIFYVGQPPRMSLLASNSLAVWKKYTGKTITGVVKGPIYSPYNNVLMGFELESGNEEFRVNTTMAEVSRLMKAITPGDIVIIEIGHASLGKDSPLPVIMPKILTKDGERLIQKGSVQI